MASGRCSAGGLGAGEQGQGARAAGLPRCCADPHHEHRLPGRRQRHGSRCAVSGAPTVTALTRYLERPGHSAGANVPDSAPGRPWRPGSVGALSQSGRSSPSAPRPWASPGAYPGTRSESVPPSLWQPPGAGLVELQEAGDWQAPTMPAHYARHQLAARGAVAKLPLPGGPATSVRTTAILTTTRSRRYGQLTHRGVRLGRCHHRRRSEPDVTAQCLELCHAVAALTDCAFSRTLPEGRCRR